MAQDKLNFEDFFKHKMPFYAMNSGSVQLLQSPREFYEEIVTQTRMARRRIIWSSLYTGCEHREINLIRSLISAKVAIPEIFIGLLMDFWRSQRDPHFIRYLNGLNHKMPKIESCLLRTVKDKSLNYLLGSKMHEIFGVMHMKFMIFDDLLIITGANIAGSYLHNRTDRYIRIYSPELSQYFSSVFDVARHLSFLRPEKKHQPFDLNSRIDFSMATGLLPFKDNIKQELSNSHVLVMPFTHNLIGQFDYTPKFFNSCAMNANHIYILAPYFNAGHFLPGFLENMPKNLKLQVLTSSLKTNAWKHGTGLSSLVPFAYSAILDNYYLPWVEKKPEFNLHQFDKCDRTFHGKGLFFDFKFFDRFVMNMGSSNYNMRSFERDIENGIWLIGMNGKLRATFDQEIQTLLGQSREIRKPLMGMFWVKPLLKLANKYL